MNQQNHVGRKFCAVVITVLCFSGACNPSKPSPRKSGIENKPAVTDTSTGTSRTESTLKTTPTAGRPPAKRIELAATPLVTKENASYMLTVTTQKCGAEFRVNDVPIVITEEDRNRDIGEIISPWLMPGDNTVSLHPIGSPASATARPCIALKVLAIPEGKSQRDALTAASAQWPTPGSATHDGLNVHFMVRKNHPCTFWTQLQPIKTLTEKDREALHTLAKKLYTAFSNKDVNELNRLSRLRGESIGQCQGDTRANGILAQRRFFEMVVTQPNFQPQPWNDDAFEITVHDNGLVKLGRSDEIMLLQAQNTGAGSDFYAGKTNDEWRIVH